VSEALTLIKQMKNEKPYW